jgi:hypothetical protein
MRGDNSADYKFAIQPPLDGVLLFKVRVGFSRRPFALISWRKREHTSDESLIVRNWLFVPG